MLDAIVLSEMKQVWHETRQTFNKRAQMKPTRIMVNYIKVCFFTHPFIPV